MIPSVEHVMKKRHHNRRRLRFTGLILVVVGMVFASWGAIMAVAEHEWFSGRPLMEFGAAFAVPAVLLWVFDGVLARALVPLPKNVCPQCGYDLTALERPLCPECGLPLPASLVRRPAGSGESPQRAN